jgi:hypothetical protein
MWIAAWQSRFQTLVLSDFMQDYALFNYVPYFFGRTRALCCYRTLDFADGLAGQME